MKKIFSIFIVLTLTFSLFTACGNDGNNITGVTSEEKHINESDKTSQNNTSQESAPIEVEFAASDEDMFSNRDKEGTYDANDAIPIILNGNTATCNSNLVNINGSTVTITGEATFIVSGTLDNGSLVVNTNDTAKLQIIFDNVSISNDSSAPLYIIEADKVFVTLAENSENYLITNGEFIAIDDNNIDGAVFSKQDLTFNGTGNLSVSCENGHGIVCKDDLVFTDGTYTITSSSHGLDANDSIRISNADITINSGKDGMHAENTDDATLGFVYISSGTFNIEAEGDGISGSNYVQIENGDINLVTGGGSKNAESHSSNNWGDFGGGHGGGMRPGGNKKPGEFNPENITPDVMTPPDVTAPDVTTPDTNEDNNNDSTSIKGIKASNGILISNGNYNIDSADDAIHSNGDITINGGDLIIKTGDDGLHADNKLNVAGGNIEITESYEGLEGLNIFIYGGDINILASDDGINAAGGVDSSGMGGFRGGDKFGGTGNGSICILGGSIYVNASGDGIDANGSLEITGGYTIVCGPTNGDTSVLDYDGSATITGGTFIGTGAAKMSQTFNITTQGVISLNVGNMAADTNITIKDGDDNILIEYSPKLNYQLAIFSSPDIISGDEYEVSFGDETNTFQAY